MDGKLLKFGEVEIELVTNFVLDFRTKITYNDVLNLVVVYIFPEPYRCEIWQTRSCRKRFVGI